MSNTTLRGQNRFIEVSRRSSEKGGLLLRYKADNSLPMGVRKHEQQYIDSLTSGYSSASHGAVITSVNHGNIWNRGSLSFEIIFTDTVMSSDSLTAGVELDVNCYRRRIMTTEKNRKGRRTSEPSLGIIF